MIGNNRVLALVPARGGSKGVARKNLRLVAGKSLLAWTAAAASGSKYIDRTILSSDDDEIMEQARSLSVDVPFRRPAELATDTASAVDAAVHAIESLDESFEILVLLQPTSPLRISEDIDGCLELLASRNGRSSASVHAVAKPPEWMFRLDDALHMHPVLDHFDDSRRQDLEPTYVLNGAVFACRIEVLLSSKRFVTDETLAYVMPRQRSLDIDEETDLVIAEALLSAT